MQTRSSRSLARHLIGHSAMGAGLGMLLALSLMVCEQHLYELIAASPAPTLTILVFAGTLTSLFTVGAGLSGLIFALLDDPPRPEERAGAKRRKMK
jgi:hypothetical protein